MKVLLVVLTLAAVAGCANSATGIVAIGDGRYMTSKVEHWGSSGGAVKVELYRDAAAFCAKMGKKMVPGQSTSGDPGLATYASAEVQFSCV